MARPVLPSALRGFLIALALTLPGRPAAALSVDGAAPAEGLAASPGRTVAGRVAEAQSGRGEDGVLRTWIRLADRSGLEVARFQVPGGREGHVQWVVDGVPTFAVGQEVEVRLVDSPAGPTVTGDGGAGFPPGGFAAVAVPRVDSIDPALGGAVPDEMLTVTVRGAGFGARQGTSRITFQGLFERVDAPVLSWSDTEIRCLVPAPGWRGIPQVLSGPIKVWTEAGGWSDGDPFDGGPRFRVLYQWAGDSWPVGRLPVSVYVNPEGFPWGAATGGIVADVLARWNVPGSYARFVYRGLTQADAGNHRNAPTAADGRNTVRWRKPWPHPEGWLAVTWSALDTLTLERLETEIEVNGDRAWTLNPEEDQNAFDFPSTLVHEFGHWIRLGHVQGVASVMTASTTAGMRRREISPADAFGASWVHPSYGIVEAPSAVPSGAPLDVSLLAFDRQGSPRPGLPGEAIELRAVPVDPQGDPSCAAACAPSTLAPATGTALPPVHPQAGTDLEGRTSAVLAGLADGLYRLEVTIEGHLVRPAPLVRVGPVTSAPAPALALAGVSPQPLLPGARGVLRFSLPSSTHVRVDLYDARGARLAAVANERFGAGSHALTFDPVDKDGAALRPGVYFLRLAAVAGADFAPLTRRVVVLR